MGAGSGAPAGKEAAGEGLAAGAGVGPGSGAGVTICVGVGGRLAAAPSEPAVPLMTPWKPAGKKPPMPVVLPIVAMLISCK
jgi:hypothetical protein